MRYVAKTGFVLVVVSLLLSAACDNGDSPTVPTPPNPITETFTGVVNLNGSVVHPFVATTAGSVTATITAVDPSTSPSFGFAMGTWNGAVCTEIMVNNLATTSAALTGTVVAPSNLCVRMFDSQGNVPTEAPINYTVEVVHP
jgi:hypothetical protein